MCWNYAVDLSLVLLHWALNFLWYAQLAHNSARESLIVLLHCVSPAIFLYKLGETTSNVGEQQRPWDAYDDAIEPLIWWLWRDLLQKYHQSWIVHKLYIDTAQALLIEFGPSIITIVWRDPSFMFGTCGLISNQDVPKASVPMNDDNQSQNEDGQLKSKLQVLHKVQKWYNSAQAQQSDELQDADHTKWF